jgi:hypothetical protein
VWLHEQIPKVHVFKNMISILVLIINITRGGSRAQPFYKCEIFTLIRNRIFVRTPKIMGTLAMYPFGFAKYRSRKAGSALSCRIIN